MSHNSVLPTLNSQLYTLNSQLYKSDISVRKQTQGSPSPQKLQIQQPSRLPRLPSWPHGALTPRPRRMRARKLRAISSARLWRRRLYTCTLSTSSSRTTLVRRSNLVAGFVLRCIQRLSDPDADTRRCPWRDNRQTGGLSNTVLSY